MMDKKLPVTPPGLLREWREAIASLNALGKADRVKMIKIYRRNRSRYIATWGISNIGAIAEGLEPISYEWNIAVADFEKARLALEKYRYDNGADDHVSQKVMKIINKALSSAPRPKSKKVSEGELVEFLIDNGYFESLHKAAIRDRALRRFDITAATFYRRLKESE